MKQSLLLMLAAFLLKGCTYCRSEEVPRILLMFNQQNLYQYTEVYNENISFNPEGNFNGYFPLNLNSDTTTIYLRNQEGPPHIISIRYKRETVFENTGCGFYLSISEPELLPETTFANIHVRYNYPYLEVEL